MIDEPSVEKTLKACYNCDTPLEEKAKYCPTCGQKYTTGKISLKHLFGEFFKDYFHWDTKLPKSLLLLLTQPGKLTNEYFKGRHQSYVRPLRLFGATTLIFLAFIIIKYVSQIDDNNMPSALNRERQVERVAEYHLRLKVDTALVEAKSHIRSKGIHVLLDTTFQDLTTKEDNIQDSINLGLIKDERSIRVSVEDAVSMSPKEVIEKYEVTDYWERIAIVQELRFLHDGKNFPRFIAEKSSWMFFIMMPFFALLLKLLYVRRKRYYVEHLIFAFHYHAFVFLFLLILFPLLDFLDGTVWGITLGLGVLYIFLYLFLAMRKVYQQSRRKTFLKYSFLLFSYMFLFVIAISATIFISFVLF